MDGFRLDAVKHMDFTFYTHWLEELRRYSGRSLMAVGEYWSWELDKLRHYLDVCGHCMQLFDVPLHYQFVRAATSNAQFDMREILNSTLVQSRSPRLHLWIIMTPSLPKLWPPGFRPGLSRWRMR